MVDEVAQQVTREEFDTFKKQVAKEFVAMHADHLTLLAMMKDAHEREKQALLANLEMFKRHQDSIKTIVGDFVAEIKFVYEPQPVHIDIN